MFVIYNGNFNGMTKLVNLNARTELTKLANVVKHTTILASKPKKHQRNCVRRFNDKNVKVSFSFKSIIKWKYVLICGLGVETLDH